MNKKWKRMDLNEDNKVTRDEYKSFNKSKYEIMDSDQNGEISHDEFKKHMRKKHSRHKKGKKCNKH